MYQTKENIFFLKKALITSSNQKILLYLKKNMIDYNFIILMSYFILANSVDN